MGLLGSNGAGKSTTIKIITGQIKPTSGGVSVMGIDPTRDPKKVHPLIGYIPDSQTVYDDITVEQNIDVFRQIHGQPRERTALIIEQLELSDKAKTKVKNLSKGLKQRVLIARALIHDPKVILLDEPTTGLDPSSAESIYRILENLKKDGATILLTTHLMNDVDRLCDRIVFLNKGEKVEEGTPLELKRRYRKPTLEVTTIENERLSTTEISMTKDFVAELAKINQSQTIYSVKTHEPKLEDIFIKLVGGDR